MLIPKRPTSNETEEDLLLEQQEFIMKNNLNPKSNVQHPIKAVQNVFGEILERNPVYTIPVFKSSKSGFPIPSHRTVSSIRSNSAKPIKPSTSSFRQFQNESYQIHDENLRFF